MGGASLTYPKLDVEDGTYKFLLKQDKCEVVFDKKNAKAVENPVTKAIKGQSLVVSCYDEEPQHKINVIYAKISGFAEYVTLVVPNNFSAYKMPKFKINIPVDGFELTK